MKPLLESIQNGLQRTPQNDVRIDSGSNQFVVKSRRHREDQAVLDHWMGRRGFDLPHVLHPGIADSFFPLGIAQSHWRSPTPVWIQNDPMMEKSSGVNLA
jgi:hypothetical protein